VRIFLTGGTGYIGAAVLDALVRAGHHVDALVRNTHKAARVEERGAHPVRGDLASPDTYTAAAAAADAIVHAAFEYTARGTTVDATAVDALLTAARASASVRAFIYTSGVWVLGNTPTPADESAPVNPIELTAWRPEHERRVLDAASPTLRTIVVRPGVVYGGGRGIVGEILKDASNSLIRVIGSGDNRWSLVYDRDLADLYLRLAEHAEASGIYHANDEGDERVNEIVAAISEHAKTTPSVRHVPLAEAKQKMGPYAEALALDQVVRSPRARALGWVPSLKSVSGNAARLFEEWRRSAQREAGA
jgi:nucleoside-diphosphate-sugar epimerase